MIAVSFFAVWKNYDGPHLSVSNITSGLTHILPTESGNAAFVNAMNDAQNSFMQSSQDLKSERPAGLKSSETAVAKAIDELRKSPSLDATTDRIVRELLMVMQDQYNLLQEVERSGTTTFASDQQLKVNEDKFNSIVQRFSKWVQSDGERYGIGMGKDR
jgi:hypothetical protein